MPEQTDTGLDRVRQDNLSIVVTAYYCDYTCVGVSKTCVDMMCLIIGNRLTLFQSVVCDSYSFFFFFQVGFGSGYWSI